MPLILTALLALATAWAGNRPADIPFQKLALDLGANETCAFADVNGDGLLDIVAGENWFEAPRWVRHRFRDIEFTNNYIDDLSDLALDVNGDGRTDVISCSWFSKKVVWLENPGAAGSWKEHVIDSGHHTEFCFLVDLDNDGKARELLPQYGSAESPLAWYEPRGGTFVRHMIDPRSHGHGIGAGDVNRDGRADVLTPEGWFEAPADPRSGAWTFHADFSLGATGFLHVLDVNEDDRNDILTSLAHDYGIFWLEQGGNGKWTRHVIDESWSQAHAVTLVDLNGDGRLDLLTGKRYMAHNGKDPGEREPLGIYLYLRLASAGGRRVEWSRHVIDYSSHAGGGMQIPVADIDRDGDLDFAVGGKSGLFLFENLSKPARGAGP